MKFNIILLFILIIKLPAIGQVKVGYIDYDSILAAFPYLIESQKFIDIRGKEMKDSLEMIYKTIAYEYIYGPCLPQSLDSSILNRLNRQFDSLQNYCEQYKNYYHNEIQRISEEEHKKISYMIKIEGINFSKYNNIDYLFEKKSIQFCSECKNYTTELIDFINQKK